MKKAKYITANRRQRGFTMIEMLVTIAIVAVLASIAVPSMRTYVLNSRITGASQEILRTVQTARSEATKRQRIVVVCASANPTADADDVTCETSGITGWVMFEDTDNSGDHEAGEELIEAHTIDATKLTLLGNGVVSYAASGFANPGSATAVVVCDSRGNVDSNGATSGTNSVARGIAITGTGRARVTKTLSEITTLIGLTGGTC